MDNDSPAVERSPVTYKVLIDALWKAGAGVGDKDAINRNRDRYRDRDKAMYVSDKLSRLARGLIVYMCRGPYLDHISCYG